MSNMAYCRFRNTFEDLRDCEEHLDEILDDPSINNDDAEKRAARALIRVCRRIANGYEEVE